KTENGTENSGKLENSKLPTKQSTEDCLSLNLTAYMDPYGSWTSKGQWCRVLLGVSGGGVVGVVGSGGVEQGMRESRVAGVAGKRGRVQ
nr:hypothetical protein [Tanacetum cinerariifolium]